MAKVTKVPKQKWMEYEEPTPRGFDAKNYTAPQKATGQIRSAAANTKDFDQPQRVAGVVANYQPPASPAIPEKMGLHSVPGGASQPSTLPADASRTWSAIPPDPLELVSNRRGISLARVIADPFSQYDQSNYSPIVSAANGGDKYDNFPAAERRYAAQGETQDAANRRAVALAGMLLNDALPSQGQSQDDINQMWMDYWNGKGPRPPEGSVFTGGGYYGYQGSYQPQVSGGGSSYGVSRGGGGGVDYSKAPYAWMSKLLNWNVNR